FMCDNPANDMRKNALPFIEEKSRSKAFMPSTQKYFYGRTLVFALVMAASFACQMEAHAAPKPVVTFYKPDNSTVGYDKAKIRILSHNVFWFQGYPFLTDAPPAPREEI